jgi:predicted secreted protein
MMTQRMAGFELFTRRLLATALVISPTLGASAEESRGYDQISLSTSTETQVPRDILIANLYARSEGPSLEAGTAEVNRAITVALETVRKTAEVSVQTQEYQTEPSYQNQKPSGWVVQQGIRLESRQPERLARLLGELQKTLKLGGIDYAVAPETRKSAEDRLISEGLKAFQTRAERVTHDLGRNRYRIIKIEVGSNPPPFRSGRPMLRAMSAEAASAPQIEAGETTLSMTIQGTIELQPN